MTTITLNPITPSDIIHIHRGHSQPKVKRYYAVRFTTWEVTQEQMGCCASFEVGADG